MSEAAMRATLQLLVVAGSLEQRLGPTLSSVHGISLQEMLLLLNLERSPLHRMRRVDLAAAMNIGASSVSHLGDPLEKDGLVRREVDTRDARVAYMVVTEEGMIRLKEARVTLADLSSRLFDERWTEADVQKFVLRLGQLAYGSTSKVIG